MSYGCWIYWKQISVAGQRAVRAAGGRHSQRSHVGEQKRVKNRQRGHTDLAGHPFRQLPNFIIGCDTRTGSKIEVE